MANNNGLRQGRTAQRAESSGAVCRVAAPKKTPAGAGDFESV